MSCVDDYSIGKRKVNVSWQYLAAQTNDFL